MTLVAVLAKKPDNEAGMLIDLLTHSLTHSLAYLLTHWLTHSPAHLLTHTYSLTHSLTHLLTHSLTHSLMKQVFLISQNLTNLRQLRIQSGIIHVVVVFHLHLQ